MNKSPSRINAISIDVEEYFHATNMDPYIGRKRWSGMASRLAHSIDLTLDALQQKNTRATFFVLGLVAEQHPNIVRRIAEAGHEIASHGFEHRLVYDQSRSEFLQDITKTKTLLEQIIGEKIAGYRAPNFSITERAPWAHSALIEAGYSYDSSVYPIWHPRYANPNATREPHLVEVDGSCLVEIPASTFELRFFGKKLRLPIAGGAYWRLLPQMVIARAMQQVSEGDQLPLVSYFHPWELDSEQPRITEMAQLTKLRHYGGLASFNGKLRSFLEQFRFTTISEMLKKRYPRFSTVLESQLNG